MSGDGDDDARALSREDLVYKAKLAEQAERCVRAQNEGGEGSRASPIARSRVRGDARAARWTRGVGQGG